MFVTDYLPPEKRRPFASGGIERRITEAAVMLAYAFHLIEQGSERVAIHPDGEHAKIFDIQGFLLKSGYQMVESTGRTSYGGRYNNGTTTIVVHPASGLGDVVGEVNGQLVIAECKGGVINTTHSGQKSRLRQGLCELVGQLMWLPLNGSRQVAVLPATPDSRRLSEKLAQRCRVAGIEIALVDTDGSITYVNSKQEDGRIVGVKDVLQAMDLAGVELDRDPTPTRDVDF